MTDKSFEQKRRVKGPARRLGVELLANVPVQELGLYILQLTQALKFEPFHDSPLARLLLLRALQVHYLAVNHSHCSNHSLTD